ncbi:MAG: S8 family serine peptidase [Acidobacteria bacterium]|nr:S8 family serine peptidase [Acidobacteriota bacterium]
MKKSRWVLGSLVLLSSVTLGGWLLSVQAQRADAQAKIAPWLQARLADTQQEFEFLVVLKEQADLSDAALLPTKEAKGRYVRETLWQTAQRSQTPLVAWLKERNATYRSFYILNALWVKGSNALAREIAARPEVARLEGNPSLTFTQPVEATIELPYQRLSPEQSVVEPGINYIHANELWKDGFTGQSIVVGGQDTGVDWSHPAIQTHYRGNKSEPSGETSAHDYNWHDSVHSGGGDCGPDTVAPCDDHGHGTHTLGTAIGADALNQIGVAPGAQFIACRNMDRGNGTPATYLECFEFMLAPYPVKGTPEQGDPTKAPDLTVNSWSCPPSEGCAPDTLRLAIEAQRAAGIMTVVAAGNEGPGCSTINSPPGHYEAAYSIGALDANTGNIASFSSRGPITFGTNPHVKPDLSAPGVFVRSAYRNRGFAFLSGTSMATPHVAGAVALLWSARPELKNQNCVDRKPLE